MTAIIHAAVFGSFARGSNDIHSDFDVIAVVDSTKDFDKRSIEAEVQKIFNKKIGLSIYSANRIRELWKEGSPFAWHLFEESIPLVQYSTGLSEWLRAPAEYLSAKSDIGMMTGILESATQRIGTCPSSAHCYEAGLLYVGSRNCAMYASKGLTGTFDFSRLAPYSIKSAPFPLSLEDYKRLTACRHASTRGFNPPQLDSNILKRQAYELLRWTSELRQALD